MSYELWSLVSRNLMHGFDTQAEAIETARLYLDAGDVQPSELAIVIYDDDGVPSGSVSGEELVSLVREHASETGRLTA